MSEAWKQEQKHEQRAQDFRFYRVIETIRAAAGVKERLSPGAVFPSLDDVKINEDESEEDLEKSYRDIRNMLSQVARQSTPVGK